MSPAAGEAAVLRRTRLRLMAWSGGSTLLVLIVLGVAIYAAAASSLAASSTQQLEARLADLAPATVDVGGGGAMFASGGSLVVTTDPSRPGVVFGGDLSGTIGIVTMVSANSGVAPAPGVATALGPAAGGADASSAAATGGGSSSSTGTINLSGASLGPAGGSPGSASPLLAAAALPGIAPSLLREAVAGQTVVLETSMSGTPVRVVVGPVGAATVVGTVTVPGGTDSVALGMVIGTRTAELDTLRTLLGVLVAGGLAVLAASVALGYVYAGRALVPIRDSLRRQREFTADASHELRTPLAITRAAADVLRRDRDDPAAVDRALDDLDAGTTRLASLVDDLLLLARADAGAAELSLADTDLALAAAEATEGLEPLAAARGVRLVLDIAPAPIRGDEARLRQLASILADNAIRHSPPGGRVVVTVRPGATLSVEDDGPGVAAEHLEQVFDRFWRAPGAPEGGTGLGLAIARWIVERHGGTIGAANRQADPSQPGTPGAVFTVHLPVG